MHPFNEPQLGGTPNAQPPRGKTVVPLAFRLERQDLHAFYTMAIKRGAGAGFLSQLSVSLRGLALCSFPIVFIISFCIFFFNNTQSTNVWMLVSIVLANLLVILVLHIIFTNKALRPPENGPVLGRRTYEIDDDGLVISQEGTQQAFMWSSVHEVLEDDKCIYLFIDQNMAHIFPKAVFASNIQAQEFAAFAREKVNLSRF